MACSLPTFDHPPYRLSGVVYGTLLNDPAELAALGDAVQQPPYKAPPKAPVLYLKPRNTLSSTGAPLSVPAGHEALQVGASLGLVIARTCCRVTAQKALSHVGGYLIVNDVTLPHDSFYRPSVRLRSRDGYCPLGSKVTDASAIDNPDDLAIRVWVDGQLAQSTNTKHGLRSAARLLADVSDFMTLHPGDVLTLGSRHGAPLVRAGQSVTIEIDGLGRLENHVVREEVAA